MQERSSIFLRLLLNRYHQGPQDAILALLPDDEGKEVSEQPIPSGDIEATLTSPLDALKRTHYSWLLDSLTELPKPSVAYLLGLMQEEKAEKIKTALKIKNKASNLTPLMKRFILGRLAKDFPFKETPPFEQIPETELTPLANLKKQELVQLIDFLGLYDLSEEIHNIVDKRLLENINNALTPKKKSYVKKCLLSKEKLVTNRLNLEFWDGDPAKLSKLIHHRGMVRLGYALCNQDKHLVWHITHILDSGRGKKLLRYINDKEIPGVTKTLREQVLDVMAFFKKGSKT